MMAALMKISFLWVTMKKILLTTTLALAGLIACQNSTKSTATEKEPAEEKLPAKLVDRIELVDLAGNVISLADFKGKTVFLNYWATWCRPCLAEMPDIDKAAKILSEEGFVFLAASDEDIEKIKKFVAKVDYSFKFVHSKTSVFDLDIAALPTTFVINKQGEVVYNEVGARDWASATELENLRKLAGQ